MSSFIYSDKKGIEYVIKKEFRIPSPQPYEVGKRAIKLPIQVNENGLTLTKIKLECLPVIKSSVYISISTL